MKIRAILQQRNKPNINGHIYPTELLKREVDKWKELIKENKAFIYKHTPDVSNIMNFHDIVGQIKDIGMDGDNLVMEAEMSYSKKDIQSLFNNGKISCRTGGFCSMTKREDGTHYMNDDYKADCIFLTDNPA